MISACNMKRSTDEKGGNWTIAISHECIEMVRCVCPVAPADGFVRNEIVDYTNYHRGSV